MKRVGIIAGLILLMGGLITAYYVNNPPTVQVNYLQTAYERE